MLRRKQNLIVLILGLLFSTIVNAQSIDQLFHQPHDPIAGHPREKITIVEFFDYQCGHCVAMAPVISAIIHANPNVRVVFKEYPIRGPMSEFASQAALAANKQGKYYPFSHALLSAHQPLTEELVFAIAQAMKLNIKQLKKDMQSNLVIAQLNANRKLADDLQLSGTPAFFIGKTNSKDSNAVRYILGEMTQNEMQEAINKINIA